MMKYLVRAIWLWDGILEAQSKHIKTEWSEVFQERSLDLLDEESLSLYMYCQFFLTIYSGISCLIICFNTRDNVLEGVLAYSIHCG